MQNKPLTSDEITTITIAVQCFKENELPDKDRAYSSDAEISAGLDLFLSYCKRPKIQTFSANPENTGQPQEHGA